jgi:hypothetical protein
MFATISVEFRDGVNTFETHPMAAKAVQSWRIEQDTIPETWTLTINNPSSGTFKVGLKSPLESTTWYSDAIACNSNAGTMRNKLYGFFSANTRTSSDISVSLTMYDASGAVTTTSSAATKYVYTIKLKKRITGFSFSTGAAYPIGTIASTVTIQPPYGATGI